MTTPAIPNAATAEEPRRCRIELRLIAVTARICSSMGGFVAFLEPPALDERIVNQYALFSLMPSPHARMDEWLGGHEELVRRIVLPAGLKWEVRDKLDQANITERVLFPGLDGLATWLKRYFSPRSVASGADPP
jgi:hypothetical protein